MISEYATRLVKVQELKRKVEEKWKTSPSMSIERSVWYSLVVELSTLDETNPQSKRNILAYLHAREANNIMKAAIGETLDMFEDVPDVFPKKGIIRVKWCNSGEIIDNDRNGLGYGLLYLDELADFIRNGGIIFTYDDQEEKKWTLEYIEEIRRYWQ